MGRLLIKEINVWSVARTVFPLAWIVSAVVIFGSTLFVGSLVSNLIGEFTDAPFVDPRSGVLAGIMLGLILGFFNSILTTLVAVLAAGIYNFLAALGGGITVSLAEQILQQEAPEAASPEQTDEGA